MMTTRLVDTACMRWDKQLRSQVQILPTRLRLAFGAACAERVSQAYATHCTAVHSKPVLLDALTTEWNVARGLEAPASIETVKDQIDEWTQTDVPAAGAGHFAAVAI